MPLGITSKLWINASVYAVPAWVLVDLIADLQFNDSWNEGDSSVRRSRLQTTEKTNRAIEFTGRVRKDTSDAGFLALRNAYINDLTLDILVLDGPANLNGSEGIRCDMKVFAFNENQGLQEVSFKEFTLKPSISVNLPKVAAIVGGVIVYSDFAA